MAGHGGRLLVIACGALAREINWLRVNHNWRHVEVTCLDAALHNRPESIPDAVDNLIQQHQPHYDQLFVAYGDCGTGGRLDAVLQRRGVDRLPGAHCYSFYATEHRFEALAADEPGTFYLTDFLVRHFDRLVVQGLKLDQYPELQAQLFAHYQRVVYLAQTDEPDLHRAAAAAAQRLGLPLTTVATGLGELASELTAQVLKLDTDSEAQHAAH